jgi:hypothetical protein
MDRRLDRSTQARTNLPFGLRTGGRRLPHEKTKHVVRQPFTLTVT